MGNYNKVILLGYLTRDPQLSYTPTQTPVCEFGMAMNETWKNKSGQKQSKACFVDCTLYGKSGELLANSLTKGSQVLVDGSLDYSSWDASDGSKRNKLRVNVQKFEFVGGGNGEPRDSYSSEPHTAEPEFSQEDFDEDIPF